MTLSTQLITTKEDCNALLANAMKEKADLEYRKLTLERHKMVSSSSSVTIAVDLQTIIAQISVSQTILAALPDGKEKDKENEKLLGLQYRYAVLSNRKKSRGIVAVLETEYDIGCIDKQLAENTAFVEAVTVRMNDL